MLRRSSSLALAEAPQARGGRRPLASAPAVPLAAAGRGEPLFFYGTLIDRDVLAHVLGRAVDPGDLERAAVEGFARVQAPGASYPIVLPSAAARVEGLLLRGAGRRDIVRVNHYESGEYRAELWPVLAGAGAGPRSAWLYVPLKAPAGPAGPPWKLEAWRREHKAAFFAACDGWMADCPEPW